MFELFDRRVLLRSPYRPTDDEVVYSKRLGNKVLVDLNRSNPLYCDLRSTRRSNNSNILCCAYNGEAV